MKNKNIFLVKFAVVAVAIGLFSPSVSVKPEVKSSHGYAAAPMQIDVTLFNTAEAKRSRNKNTNRNRNTNKNRNSNKNVNRNVNKNVNRNVNKNVNVNVNHRNNRYYGRPGYYGGKPLAVFTTGLIIGSMVSASSMPSTCTTVITNGISYRRCDNSYYQPYYEGDVLAYKVVSSPY